MEKAVKRRKKYSNNYDFTPHAQERIAERMPYIDFDLTIKYLKKRLKRNRATINATRKNRKVIRFKRDDVCYKIIVNKEITIIVTASRSPLFKWP